jgi:hypothetical protein
MLSLKKYPDLPVVISDKEMAANPPPKKEKLTPVGFRCNYEVRDIYKINKAHSYHRNFF